MNSNQIFEAIEEIAATSSTKAKQELLKKYCADEDFIRVLKYAYDPFITFGMQQMPMVIEPGGTQVFDDGVWLVLDDLASRRLTGNDAAYRVGTELSALSTQSAELLRRIIRKNLRAGFSEGTINKVVKGLIPEFAYMRCSLPKHVDLDAWPWEDGVLSQEKADAMFANLDIEANGEVSLRSRQGSPLPVEKFADLVAEARDTLRWGNQHHGELMVVRDGAILPRAESNGVIDRVVDGGDFEDNEWPIYLAWDQVPLSRIEKKGKCEIPYKTRFGCLCEQVAKDGGGVYIGTIPTRIVRSRAEAFAHAAELMKEGKEGTIIKHPEAPWEDGTSKHQVKVKLEFTVDLKIVGIVPGKAGTKNEGRAGCFACESDDGLLKVDVTVKNEALRDRVDADPEEFIDRIIAVTANDITTPGENNEFHSLYLGRMAEGNYRSDKMVADTLQRIFDQKEAAIQGETLVEAA